MTATEINQAFEDWNNIEHDWDGYGGIPPFPEILEKARIFINSLPHDLRYKISDIYGMPHGTMVIEWVNENEDKLSMEIGRNSYAYFVRYKARSAKLVNAFDPLSDLAKIKDDITSIYS